MDIETYTIAILPDAVLKQLAQFLLDKKTGQVIMNFNCGRIESYELREHYRVRVI